MGEEWGWNLEKGTNNYIRKEKDLMWGGDNIKHKLRSKINSTYYPEDL